MRVISVAAWAAVTVSSGFACGRSTLGLADVEDGGAQDAAEASATGDAGSSSSSGSGSGGSGSGSGSGSSGGGSSSGGGNGSGSGSGGGSGSGSGSSGGSGSGSGSGSGGPSGYGSILVDQCRDVCGAPSQFYIQADFYDSPAPDNCQPMVTSGSCAFYACSPPSQPNGVSAGTLSVTTELLGTVTVTASPPTYTYAYSFGSQVFQGNTDMVTVSATGATVPAFGLVSVPAPNLLQLYEPPPNTEGGTPTFSTSGDVPVAWYGGRSGATVLVEGLTRPASFFACQFDAAAGQGVIPHAVVAPMAGQGAGYLYSSQVASTLFYAGQYAITLSARSDDGWAVEFQ